MDLNEYVKNGGVGGGTNKNGDASSMHVDPNLANLVGSLAGKFDGKSQTELLKAIYEEAKKGKERGTLSNRDIDNFVSMITPMLDAKKRKILFKVAEELKKI